MSIGEYHKLESFIKNGRTHLKVVGRLDRDSAVSFFDWIQVKLPNDQEKVGLDLSEIDYLDSAGVAVLVESLRLAKDRGCKIELVKVSEPAKKTLELFRFRDEQENTTHAMKTVFESLGENWFRWFATGKWVLFMMADVFYWAIWGPFSKLGGAPKGETTRQAILLGSRAFGIIALLAFLIGLTLALLSAHQLRQFGANIYVANLVAIAMAREMGPMMTAIIVAGRSGSAIAAEIATMQVTEEVDALQSMGFSPVRFLVIPKLYAITLAQPLLTVISIVFGIVGGMIIGSISLGVPVQAFFHQATDALVFKDIATGLLKSIAFGWIILLVGVYCGLKTRGGADAVGASTTQSVVLSIFFVIVADCAFSLAFYT